MEKLFDNVVQHLLREKATVEKNVDCQLDIQKWEHDMSVSEKS